MQIWFAGNHSDVGGSYAEPESRLSDIALAWMAEQATKIQNGLKTGPILIDGNKLPNTGDAGECLHLYPAADGVQHCEIASMSDTLERYAEKLPLRWFDKIIARRNWEVKVRDNPVDARVHSTVEQRFLLPSVVQCAGVGPYRPVALKNHDKFKALYPAKDSARTL